MSRDTTFSGTRHYVQFIALLALTFLYGCASAPMVIGNTKIGEPVIDWRNEARPIDCSGAQLLFLSKATEVPRVGLPSAGKKRGPEPELTYYDKPFVEKSISLAKARWGILRNSGAKGIPVHIYLGIDRIYYSQSKQYPYSLVRIKVITNVKIVLDGEVLIDGEYTAGPLYSKDMRTGLSWNDDAIVNAYVNLMLEGTALAFDRALYELSNKC